MPDEVKGQQAALITEESVWCEDCGEIRPVRYDYMSAVKGLNDHDATDIMCDNAHIVATLHHPSALAKFLGEALVGDSAKHASRGNGR